MVAPFLKASSNKVVVVFPLLFRLPHIELADEVPLDRLSSDFFLLPSNGGCDSF